MTSVLRWSSFYFVMLENKNYSNEGEFHPVCSAMNEMPKNYMGSILIVKIVTFIRMHDDIRSYDVVTLIIKIR